MANLIMENTVVLLILAAERDSWWVVEQPVSSWMFRQASMVDLYFRTSARKQTEEHHMYGAVWTLDAEVRAYVGTIAHVGFVDSLQAIL